MSNKLEANKRVVRAYVEQVFNGHRPDLATKFVTPDVVWRGGLLGTVTGATNLVGMLTASIGPLPDLYADEQDIAAEGDLVTVRYVVTGTVQGALLGIPADGKKLRWDAVDIYRITDGKISEEWALDDIATLLVQLGAFTPPWAG